MSGREDESPSIPKSPRKDRFTVTKKKQHKDFEEKDRVAHAVHGPGTIAAVTPRLVTIDFDDGRQRRFLAERVELSPHDSPAPPKKKKTTKKKAATKKAATKKTATKKAATKKTAKKTTKKAVAKKTTKKATAQKSTAKAAGKKTAARKTTAAKATAKKTTKKAGA